MGSGQIRSVAVVGNGPAGTALANWLARSGIRVGLYSRGRPKGPLVGESLIPRVVSFLRDLELEDEVRSYGVLKPGATFFVSRTESVDLRFAEVCRRVPGYAYNVPRDRLDATLLDACVRSGARVIEGAARLERAEDGPDGPRVRLSQASLEAAGDCFDGDPDFIVDASGRARVLARLLDLPAQAGDRTDQALFAHFEGIPIEQPGYIHTDLVEHGWCWRIPLQGRVSLGVVVNPEVLRGFGSRPEEQLDAFLQADPHLAKLSADARRVTPVMRYTNWQLTTERATGDGWALVGDAFGFIDPVFSSGLQLAFDGAQRLAEAISVGTPRAFRRYERHYLNHLASWREAVSTFYDRRFFDVLRLRAQPAPNLLHRIISAHVERHVPSLFTGEGTTSAYNRRLLRAVSQFAARERERAEPHTA